MYLLRLALLGSFVLLLTLPLQATSQQDSVNNAESIAKSPLEHRILPQILKGQAVDLQNHNLRSEFVEDLLRAASNLKIRPPKVDIKNAIFDEPLSLRNETFPLEVRLIHCQFRRQVDLSLAHFLELWLDGSTFGSASTPVEVNFNGMKVNANLYLQEATFYGVPTFYHLDVGGDLHGENVKFLAHLDECDHDGGGPESNDRCYVMFDQSAVKGELLLDGSQFQESLSLADVTVRGLHLQNVTVKKDLRLSHARVETVIQLNLDGEPRWAFLEGLTYQDLGGSGVGKTLSDLIENRAPYFSSASYSQLEEYYQTHGAPEEADNVFIKMKENERATQGWRARLFGWLLEKLVGYGRRPVRALIPSTFIVALGTLFFWRTGDRILQRKADETKREYNQLWYTLDPFWYSLDLFAPVIDLDAASVWMPNPNWKFGWYWARGQRILGWILVPIILAALTGLIK